MNRRPVEATAVAEVTSFEAELLLEVELELQWPESIPELSIGSTLTLHETWGPTGILWCGCKRPTWDGILTPPMGGRGKKGIWWDDVGGAWWWCVWRFMGVLQLEEAEPQWLLPTEFKLCPPKLTFRGMGIMLGWVGVATVLLVGVVVEGLELATPSSKRVAGVVKGVSQECLRMTSRLGRLSGTIWRHLRIKSWHSGDNRVRNRKSARQIWSSVSNGISPHTISNKRIPKLQTVASSPL